LRGQKLARIVSRCGFVKSGSNARMRRDYYCRIGDDSEAPAIWLRPCLVALTVFAVGEGSRVGQRLASVVGRFLRAVNDQNLDGALGGVEPQAELVLQSRENAGGVWRGVWVWIL